MLLGSRPTSYAMERTRRVLEDRAAARVEGVLFAHALETRPLANPPDLSHERARDHYPVYFDAGQGGFIGGGLGGGIGGIMDNG